MVSSEHKEFKSPDEIRGFEKGRLELLNIGEGVVGRLILEPGWRWSKHVKPIAKTEWCEAPHFQYHVSGRLHILMSDGKEFDDPFKVPGTPNRIVVFRQPLQADLKISRPLDGKQLLG